jgi:hypothetical protein
LEHAVLFAAPEVKVAVDSNVPLAHGVQATSLVAVPAAAKNEPAGQLVDQAVHVEAELEGAV